MSTSSISLNTWTDRKRPLWLLGAVIVGFPLYSFAAYWATGWGVVWWLAPLFIYGLIPVLDLLLLDEQNPHAVLFQLHQMLRSLERLEEGFGFVADGPGMEPGTLRFENCHVPASAVIGAVRMPVLSWKKCSVSPATWAASKAPSSGSPSGAPSDRSPLTSPVTTGRRPRRRASSSPPAPRASWPVRTARSGSKRRRTSGWRRSCSRCHPRARRPCR